MLGVEGDPPPAAGEPAVEQGGVGGVVADAVAGGLDDQQRHREFADAAPQAGDHPPDLQQAAGREGLGAEAVGSDPGQDVGVAAEEPVLLGHRKTPLRRHQPRQGDAQLLGRGVVGNDVETRCQHDERRHRPGPLESGTERHGGAEAVPDEVDRHAGLFGPGEVDDPADLGEPGPGPVDVAAAPRRRSGASPFQGVDGQSPVDETVGRFGEPLGVALQAVHHDEGGHGGRVPPGVAVNRRLPAVQLERPGPL